MAAPQPVCGRKPHDFPQPAPDAIALDGTADLARYGETDTDRATILAVEHLNDKGRCRHLRPAGGGQEIGALPQPLHQPGWLPQALSRLRPCERRLESTLRPPLVAMRARKP